MTDNDVPQVTHMLNAHLATYKVHISFSEAEVKHFFLPDVGGVVYSYVVDDGEGTDLTDFCSFYALNSSVLKFEADTPEEAQKLMNGEIHQVVSKHGNTCKKGYNKVNAAYCYYTVVKGNDFERHSLLMKSLMAQAADVGHDVFNMVEVLQHRRLT